jgi:hypothetical protein
MTVDATNSEVVSAGGLEAVAELKLNTSWLGILDRARRR